MKITFFEIQEWEQAYVKARLPGHDLSFCAAALSNETVSQAQDAEVVSVFIYSKINAALLDLLPKVKLVTTRSTGYDHIDLAECTKRSIAVASVPFYGENTVAEHTFALILSLSRNIHKAYVRTLKKDYSIEGLKGFDLKGKTIGIVGAGHIGLHVARVAKSFSMKVVAFDVRHDNFLSEVLGFDYVPLDELLRISDIVSIHTPYNTFTHHLINRENIHAMKKGSILINTSRGAIVDTAALIEALDAGILAGVGLDVLEGEELIKEEKQLLSKPGNIEAFTQIDKDHVLLTYDNVVFTPHIAFYSQEALERILDTTVETIQSYKLGKTENVVAVKV